MTLEMRRLVWPLQFCAMCGFIAALYFNNYDFWVQFAQVWLAVFDERALGDVRALVDAMICERRGIETYLGNPCHERPNILVYPPTWKLLAVFPVSPAWTLPLALIFSLSLAAALAWLPPARSRSGLILGTLAIISPATVFGVYNGNNEQLICALAIAASALLASGRLRMAGYGILLIAGLLKFFPFAALVIAVRERPWRFMVVVGLAIVVLVAFVLIAGDQLPLSLRNILTISPFAALYGLKNITELMQELALLDERGAMLVRIALTLVLFVAAWSLSNAFRHARLLDQLDEKTRSLLVVGSLLIVATYLATQNIAYRSILLLLVLPGLDALRRAGQFRFAVLALVSVALMYLFPVRIMVTGLFDAGSEGAMRSALLLVALREVAWFYLASSLLGVVLCEVRFSPVVQLVWQRWRNARA